MLIRKENREDIEAITEVTVAAFKTHPISRQTEQYIITALRAAGALTISLVCKVDGRVVGHIAISPVTISDGTTDWYGLGPISVLPEHQKQGIGKSLIREALTMMKAVKAKGCALVGDPGYYTRLGFKNCQGLIYEGIPQEFFLVLPFTDRLPQGRINFHEAFQATA